MNATTATEFTNMILDRTIFKHAYINRTASDPDGKLVIDVNVCIDMPPKVVSDGFWADHDQAAKPMQSTLPLLELQILTILSVLGSLISFHKSW
jgi:hypothetical protein